MENLQVFENVEFGKVRTLIIDGEPWFVGKDIADKLEYRNGSRDINRHVDDEDRRKIMVFDGSKNKETIIINESGLYTLVLKSKLESAKKFRRWITSEVIPSIRKYGGYTMPWKLEDIFHNRENIKLFLGKMLELSEENVELKNYVEELEPKAEYFEHMMDSDFAVNFTDTAKEIGVKPRDFTGFLLSQKYLYRNRKQVLLPYQKYVDKGLFEVIEFTGRHGYEGLQTLVTPIGRNFFLQLYLNGEIA